MIRFFLIGIFFLIKLNGSSYSFILENDIFAGTDRHYTNGTFYSSLEDDIRVPWVLDISSLNKKSEVFTVSQLMFTPKDIQESQKILTDSPYAGHIGLTWSLFQSSSNFFYNMGFSLGAVGPISLAKEAQRGVHKLKGVTIPEGWDNQLSNELTSGVLFQLGAKTKTINIYGIEFDWITNIRFDMGNFYTGVAMGTIIRFGNYFADNFPTTGGFVGGYESSMLNIKKVNYLGWSISIGGYGNGVGNFYVIDEGIKQGYDVEKIEYIVGDFASLNLYYKKFELEILYKSAVVNEIELNPSSVMENRGAINIKWKWD